MAWSYMVLNTGALIQLDAGVYNEIETHITNRVGNHITSFNVEGFGYEAKLVIVDETELYIKRGEKPNIPVVFDRRS